MRIGVEASCWNQRRGYGRHLRGLFSAVAEQLAEESATDELLFFLPEPPLGEYPLPANAKALYIGNSLEGDSRGWREITTWSRALSQTPLDVLIFPNTYGFVPLRSSARKFVFLHDTIARTYGRELFRSRADCLRWNAKSWLARRQADRLVTVSDYSKQRIIEAFGYSPDEVAVVSESADAAFFGPPRTNPPDQIPAGKRLVVYVGGFNPHKNLDRLWSAFEKVAAAEPDTHLILVGEPDTAAARRVHSALHERVAASPQRQQVTFAGFLSDDQLVALYHRSAVAVLPSLMEGFGLPAVEAAACGVPVVVTQESPLAALLGDGAISVDPLSSDSIASAINALLAEHRDRGEAARRAASQLTWSAAAKTLLELVRT